MNTENDNLPEDEQLSSIYKDTEQDMPAAHLDDAILAAARRETASRPRPAYGPFSNNWRVPASLAAVLVLSVGLVNLMDNEPLMPNGLEPFAIEEAEMLSASPEIASGVIMADKEMNVAKARKRDEKEQRSSERDTAPFTFRSPVAKSPQITSAEAPRPEIHQGILAKQAPSKKLNEKIARKKKQGSLVGAAVTDQVTATSAQADSLASAIPVSSVASITALRLAGKLKEANISADAFIRYHFGDNLEKLDPAQVKLTIDEWERFIAELRALERKQQAKVLEKLMNSSRN